MGKPSASAHTEPLRAGPAIGFVARLGPRAARRKGLYSGASTSVNLPIPCTIDPSVEEWALEWWVLEEKIV